MSTLRQPINILACSQPGTIFSTPSGSGGGGGATISLSNLGVTGAAVYAQTILNNAQFRRITQGNNMSISQRTSDILFDVNDLNFNGTLPIKRNIPGLQGVALNATTVLTLLQALLYPTLAPVLNLFLSIVQFEYGDTTAITANWMVTKTDENIVSINVNNVAQTVTGQTQSGSLPVSKNGLSDVVVPLQATSASQSSNTSTTASVSRKIRFGASNNDGIVNQILDSDINNLTGLFTDTYQLNPTQITIGANQYLVIAIPVSLLNGKTPQFIVNGFLNNAFTPVRVGTPFTNTFGYTEPVNVYVSNSFSTGTLQLQIN